MKRTWWFFLLFLSVCAYAYAGGHVRGSGFNEGVLEMSDYPILFDESEYDPGIPNSDRIQLYAKDKAGTTTLYTQDALGAVKEIVTGSGMTYPGAGIPISTGSAWGTSITNNSANWNTAYGWGNHASAGYLTVESDPVYSASSWFTTTNNSGDWDTAYSWGDHALAGYLTAETDPVFTAWTPYINWPADAAGALTNDGAGNLSWVAGGGGTPGGNDKNVQFNNSGVVGGSDYFLWDDSVQTLQLKTNSMIEIYNLLDTNYMTLVYGGVSVIGDNLTLEADSGDMDIIMLGDTIPYNDNFFDLGISGARWKDFWLAGDIKDGTSTWTMPSSTGTLALTSQLVTDHGALTGLSDDDHAQYLLANGTRNITGDILITGTNRFNFGDIGTYILQSADGILNLVSDTHIDFTATDIRFGGHALPTADTTYDLGSVDALGVDLRWRNLYLSGNISDETNTVSVANLKTAYDHSQDNTQAHSDYLLNNSSDSTTGALTATNFISNIAIGTQPYATTSTTLNTNLNADLLDGSHASAFQSAITGTDTRVMFFDGANTPSGDAGFTYNKTTDSATLVGTLQAEQITSTDDITMAGLFTNTMAAADIKGINIDGITNDYTGSTNPTTLYLDRDVIRTTNPQSNQGIYNGLNIKSALSGTLFFGSISNLGTYNLLNVTGAHSFAMMGEPLEENNSAFYDSLNRSGTITADAIIVTNAGGYSQVTETLAYNKAGGFMNVVNRGAWYIVTGMGAQTAGTLTRTNIGGDIVVQGDTNGTSINYGMRITVSGADVNWGFHNSSVAAHNFLGGDNLKTYEGTGQDVFTTYTGTVWDFDIAIATTSIRFNGSNFDTDFSICGDTNDDVVYLDANAEQFGVGASTTPDTRFEVQTSATWGKQSMTIDQDDADQAFIDFQGTSAADQANNISTVNGDGVVDGPKNKIASAGWTYSGMIKIEVNGAATWIPTYTAQP